MVLIAAISPATFGAANEVPLQVAQPWKDCGVRPLSPGPVSSKATNELRTSTAGVQQSTHQPWLLNGARFLPDLSSAPTAITRLNAAGHIGRLEALLPAAATTTESGLTDRSAWTRVSGGMSPWQ